MKINHIPNNDGLLSWWFIIMLYPNKYFKLWFFLAQGPLVKNPPPYASMSSINFSKFLASWATATWDWKRCWSRSDELFKVQMVQKTFHDYTIFVIKIHTIFCFDSRKSLFRLGERSININIKGPQKISKDLNTSERSNKNRCGNTWKLVMGSFMTPGIQKSGGLTLGQLFGLMTFWPLKTCAFFQLF